MLEISTYKVAQIILMARELNRAKGELTAFIENLLPEEQVSLVALLWIGRDTFDASEVDEAIATAQREAATPTVDYLMGSPHLSDHLENGLDALGVSITDDEDELIRGG